MLSFLRKHWYIPVAIVVLLCGLTALYVHINCHGYSIPQNAILQTEPDIVHFNTD